MSIAPRWALLATLAACGPNPGSETGAQTSTGAGASSSTAAPPPTPTTGEADPTSTSTSTSTGATPDPSTGLVDATTSTGGTGGTSGDSDGESGSSGGPAVHCPQTLWERGCEPVDCANLEPPCGSLFSRHDEQGQRREACPGPDCACPSGYECFHSAVWGGCVPSDIGCGFETENCGGAYCVPGGLGPPFACGGTDEAACVGAGCTFVVAPWIELGRDECQCGEAVPLCLWFPQAGPEAAKPTAYYNPFTAQTRVFQREWQQPPFGWKPCAGDPDAPPACACAEQCAP